MLGIGFALFTLEGTGGMHFIPPRDGSLRTAAYNQTHSNRAERAGAMDTREIQDKTVEAKGGAFFYEQWKRLRVSADASAAPSVAVSAAQPEAALPSPSPNAVSENKRPGGVWAGSQAWSQGLGAERHLRAVTVDPAEAAKKSLDRYKQRLQEYRDCQAARLSLLKQSEAADSPEGKARAQQGLKTLDSRLDFLEKELRHGYRRTKTAMQEIRKAS